MRAAPAILVLLWAAGARAGDEAAAIDLRAPTRWKPGETVTATVMESTRSEFSGGPPGVLPSEEIETRLEATFSLRCVEADAEGSPLRSLLFVEEWSWDGGPLPDLSLVGALVETTPAGWTLLASPANPTRKARRWLDNRFGGEGRGFIGGLSETGAGGPLEPGATWTADPPALPRGMAAGSHRLDPRKWTFTLAAGAPAKVTFDERIPFSGETNVGGLALRPAGDGTVHVSGEVAGEPGAWHRSGRMRVATERHLEGSARGMAFRLHTVSEERESWDAGGEVPAPPAAAARPIGIGERWAAGDTFRESGSESVKTTATPVGEEWKDAEPDRTATTVTWSAEIECVEADGEDGPTSLVVALGEWTATDGKTEDRSLAGAVVRVDGEGWRIDYNPAGASDRAKEWLRSRYAGGARADDPMRAAVTPLMPVAPKQSWGTDPIETAAAIQGRFSFPLVPESVRGKGTRTGVPGDPATLDYEVETSIACAPGCGGAGADVLKGTLRVRGTAEGPAADWTRRGSFRETAEVDVTVPPQQEDDPVRRLAILAERRVARTPLPPAERSAGSWTASAAARIDRSDWDGALADVARALARDPRFTDAWFQSARAKAGKKDPAGAIADYSRAIEIDPSLPGAWQNRGVQKRIAGDLEGSLADLSKAVEISPRNAAAWRQRGLTRARRKDFAGAVADYDRAIEIRPKYHEAYNDRGLARYNLDEYARAAADYTRAHELAPRDAWYLVNRGNARSAQDDLAGSLADHDAAIALDPSHARAHYFRADVRARNGDARGAREDYDRAIELDPAFADGWGDRGVLRGDAGDLEGAIADFTKAIEVDSRAARHWYHRAAPRMDLGDVPGAIADLTKAIEIHPGFVDAWNRRGNYRRTAGDLEGAIPDWEKAIELDPKAGRPRFSLALARFQPGLPPAPVVEGLWKALDPEDAEDYAQLWLWLARAKAGEEAEATRDLRVHAGIRRPDGEDDWFGVLLDLLTGKRTEEEVLAAARNPDAKTARERLCEAAFYAGMARALRGDAAKGIELLDRCLATDVRNYTEFQEARRWRAALLLGGTTRSVAGSHAREIVSPDPRGPLARAGLRERDRIAAIDGKSLEPGGLDARLLQAKPGMALPLNVRRGEESLVIVVTLGEWRE